MRAEEEFREFVSTRWARTLRVAYLLTADQESAEQLLRDAFVRTRRHWRRVRGEAEPEADLLRSLVRRTLPRPWTSPSMLLRFQRAEPGELDQQGGVAVTDGSADPDGEPEALRAALDGLPPRTRAVLVLLCYAELTEPEIAELVRCSQRVVREEATRGAGGMGRSVEELAVHLRAWADEVELRGDPYGMVVRDARRDRRRRSVGAAATACVLAVASTPLLVLRPWVEVPLEDWPVRGSLADDAGFLEDVRANVSGCTTGFVRARNNGYVSGPPVHVNANAARVLFAGDNGAHRVAVAAVPRRDNPDEGLLVFFAWRSGASADRLRCHVVSAFLNNRTAYLSWLVEKPDGGASLFVLAPPDASQLAYSTRIEFSKDGSWRRHWRELAAPSGATLTTLPRYEPLVDTLRLRLGKRTILTQPSMVFPEMPGSSYVAHGPLPRERLWRGSVRGMPAGVTPPYPKGFHRAIQGLRESTGVSVADLRVRVLWSGRLGGSLGGGQRSWLVTATLPNGATFRVFSSDREVQVMLLGDKSALPYAAVVQPGPFGVIVLAPDYPDGRVRLWRRGTPVLLWHEGERVPAVPVSDAGTVEVYSVSAVEADTFRVYDRSGKQVAKGPVGQAGEPYPWLCGTDIPAGASLLWRDPRDGAGPPPSFRWPSAPACYGRTSEGGVE